MKSKQRVLILGADGFLGSSLAEALLKKSEFRVRAFDLFNNGVTRYLDQIKDDLELYSGNFLNRSDLKSALKNVDYVFHFISLTTPGSSMHEPLVEIEANIKGSIVLFEECVSAKVKKIIFSSSGGSVYGNQTKRKFNEDSQTNPISPYAISKVTIEKYLEYFRVNYDLDYLILRYANVYGPRQNVIGSQGIIPIFLNRIMHDSPITVFGDGNNVRDYIYIDDAVDLTSSIFLEKTKHNIYNVGSGEGITINRILSIMQKVTGKNLNISKHPFRSVDVKKVILDVSRIENEFNFCIKTPIVKGIEKTWLWLNNNTMDK